MNKRREENDDIDPEAWKNEIYMSVENAISNDKDSEFDLITKDFLNLLKEETKLDHEIKKNECVLNYTIIGATSSTLDTLTPALMRKITNKYPGVSIRNNPVRFWLPHASDQEDETENVEVVHVKNRIDGVLDFIWTLMIFIICAFVAFNMIKTLFS